MNLPTTTYISTVMKAIIAVLVIVIIPSIVMAEIAETEPNDTIQQADTIGIGYANAEIGARIATEDDLDYFKFTAEAGRTYVIETFNIDGNPSQNATGLWLYNVDGSEIANDQYGDNGTGNINARIVHTFNNSGTYFILVKDARFTEWTGTYSLRVLPKYDEPGAAWDASNDYEPNDALELAYEIGVGLNQAQTHELAPHSSYITNDSDYDYYRFTAEGGRTVVIETFNIDGTPSQAATGLWLYNADGSQIANDQYGDNGTGSVNARIVHTFNNSGTYFILVKDARFTEWTGTYSLRVLPKYDEPGAAWDATNDHEPNDVPQLAYQLNVGQAQTHQLAPHANLVTNDSDYDYYRFTAEASETYTIETFNIEGETSNDATGLWLYNTNGESEIANDQYGDNGTGNVDAQITHTFSNSGTYFILVKDARFTEWTGTYSVRVFGPGGSAGSMKLFLPLTIR